MRHLLLDFRYAIRGLARTPLFTLGVVLTGVALLAAYLPARRASRLAPTIALQAK